MVIIIAGYHLKREQEYFLAAARSHANIGRSWSSYLEQWPKDVISHDLRNHASLMVYYHASLEAKYLQAARHPWFHVEPDPPKPGSSSIECSGPNF